MRDIELLTKETQQKLYRLVELCDSSGYSIKITDTLRTKAEQDALYNQGRTTPGNIVTNVAYPNSMHNWGIAFDICRAKPVNGDYYYNGDGFFDMVGMLGISAGLEWGGTWKSIVDKPHFQLAGYGSTPKKLISQYGTPEAYLNKERVNKMPTVKKGMRGTAVKAVQAVVGCEADGIYGNNTYTAVVAFQKSKNLTPDGIVGVKTWEVILSMMATNS